MTIALTHYIGKNPAIMLTIRNSARAPLQQGTTEK